MQKITAAVVLLWVSALCVSASAWLGADTWLGFAVVVVASGLVGVILVAVFARGDVIARLQRGTVVLALAVAALTMTSSGIITSDRYVPGWQRRLAQYPELRSHQPEIGRLPDAMAMDAVDSVISEHLLANQPELWRDYSRKVVACAREHTVPVETVVAVMQRETTALRRQPPEPEPPEPMFAPAEIKAWIAQDRRWDSVMADAVWDARAGRRRTAVYAAPTDAWVPNWPARLALAGSELLAGFALVIVLSFFRRKHRETSESDHAA
jgi:hypothetical protein